jgi:hypothetical protein
MNKSIEERYDDFCRDAEELLETVGLARPGQKPTIVGRAFLEACNAIATLHFPDDKEVGGIGPRGLIWDMHSAVEASNINHKDPDPVAGAKSVATILQKIIKYRPPLDLVNGPGWRERPFIDDGEVAGTQDQDEHLCFVIMSFSLNPILQDFYAKAIKPTVEGLGYRCERVDEQEFNDSIRTRILMNIKKAKFLVADVTEARPNCYYELGVAHSLNKEVIHLANSSDDIHFDANDFNFIIYSRIDELASKLYERIVATVGPAN